MNRLMIIPAAGSGSRLRSPRPKLLTEVNGRPMIDHLFDLYRPHVELFVLVVHPSFAGEVKAHCSSREEPVELAMQQEPTGMLDAILIPQLRVRELGPRSIWITWCDQIAVRPQTVTRLATLEDKDPYAGVVLPTIVRGDPYIHLVRDAKGQIQTVLQQREGDNMPSVGESDIGLFGLTLKTYLEDLARFAEKDNQDVGTGERNFLPFLGWLRGRTRVTSFPGSDEIESVGINTPEDLGYVEDHLRRG